MRESVRGAVMVVVAEPASQSKNVLACWKIHLRVSLFFQAVRQERKRKVVVKWVKNRTFTGWKIHFRVSFFFQAASEKECETRTVETFCQVSQLQIRQAVGGCVHSVHVMGFFLGTEKDDKNANSLDC